MKILIRWDALIIRCIRKALRFLNDWLSITQAHVERLCIVMAVGSMTLAHPSWWPIDLINLIACCAMHLDSSAARTRREYDQFDILWRMWVQVILLMNVAGLLYWRTVHEAYWLISQVFIVAFFYLIAIGDDHEPRGRKRKKALAKLKEWLGRAWIPEPEAMPV